MTRNAYADTNNWLLSQNASKTIHEVGRG